MFKPKRCEAYLVTKPEHIFYLTNFDGEGFVIIDEHGVTLATDQRYWLLAKKIKKAGVKLFDLKSGWSKEFSLNFIHAKTIHFEEEHLTVAGLTKWEEILPGRIWKKNDGVFRKMRTIKREDELENLRMAAALGDKVLKKVLPMIKPGVTEKHIANLLRQYSNEYADGTSFPPIVAFGKNGAVPHHHSDDTKLKKNDAILIDQGVKYKGYMSDMTRCFFIGKGVSAIRKMYEQLLAAQQAGVNMVRAGVKISELDMAVRALLGKENKYFTHSLGHGVGLEVHEDPGVSGRSETVLEPGMVITIEPGIYKPGIGGVRIEDTVIVTEQGCEVITKSTKNTVI
jgi:Xaa-Pro aminopeptidase